MWKESLSKRASGIEVRVGAFRNVVEESDQVFSFHDRFQRVEYQERREIGKVLKDLAERERKA